MTCRGPPAAAFAFIRQSSVFRPCCPALKSWWWLGLPRGGGRTSPAGSRLLLLRNGAATFARRRRAGRRRCPSVPQAPGDLEDAGQGAELGVDAGGRGPGGDRGSATRSAVEGSRGVGVARRPCGRSPGSWCPPTLPMQAGGGNVRGDGAGDLVEAAGQARDLDRVPDGARGGDQGSRGGQDLRTPSYYQPSVHRPIAPWVGRRWRGGLAQLRVAAAPTPRRATGPR